MTVQRRPMSCPEFLDGMASAGAMARPALPSG